MTQQLHKNDILYYARIMPMKKTDGSVAWKNVLK